MKKLFVVRKYIWATSAKDDIKKDKKSPVDEVWVDDEWKKTNAFKTGKVGFNPIPQGDKSP